AESVAALRQHPACVLLRGVRRAHGRFARRMHLGATTHAPGQGDAHHNQTRHEHRLPPWANIHVDPPLKSYGWLVRRFLNPGIAGATPWPMAVSISVHASRSCFDDAARQETAAAHLGKSSERHAL